MPTFDDPVVQMFISVPHRRVEYVRRIIHALEAELLTAAELVARNIVLPFDSLGMISQLTDDMHFVNTQIAAGYQFNTKAPCVRMPPQQMNKSD